MSSLSASLNSGKLLVLDGGLGTTLRDIFHKDVSGDLWNSRLLKEDPEIIYKAHYRFLESGADIILSSTYQSYLEGFTGPLLSLSKQEGEELMRSAIKLAVKARDDYVNAHPEESGKKLVGLSLGSFGATFAGTGAEYSGKFPQDKLNLESITEFHASRLSIFSSLLSQVDFVAFETIPLAIEIEALRLAMKTSGEGVPFWIGISAPSGKWADGDLGAASERLWDEDEDAKGPLPFGAALNCTDLQNLSDLIPQLAPKDTSSLIPTLILYPNHNVRFLDSSAYWDDFPASERCSKEGFAENLVHVMTEALSSGKWKEGGVIGGCCGTGPDEIAALVEEVRRGFNNEVIAGIKDCLATNTCRPNQDKVVIFSTGWCTLYYAQDFRGGEGIWCHSMVESLKRQGYSFLFSHEDPEAALMLYNLFPEVVKVVIGDSIKKHDTQFMKSVKNPKGIPAWKIMYFNYYPITGQSIVGDEWIVTAEVDDQPYDRGFTYIGYSVNCSELNHTPFEHRENKAWMFGKELKYFHPDQSSFATAFPMDFPSKYASDAALDHHPHVKFVGGWKDSRNGEERMRVALEDPQDVLNVGKLDQAAFRHEVSTSKVIVGLGNPWYSPTPYEALCLGVPFLNPILDWRLDLPDEKIYWTSQQPTLRQLEPPYVYHVHKDNYEEYKHAISSAMSHPIESTVLPHMTEAALDHRIKTLIETDWHGKAAVILAQRQSGKDKGGTFTL